MSDFGLSYKVIESFFDRPKVLAAVDRATRSRLSKAGAFVRTAARSRIRKRKKSAQPGQSPSSHAGGLKKGIVFAYDAGRDSVVIGPLRYNVDGGRVPALLEFGGTIRRTIRKGGRRRGAAATVTQTYQAFPYMGPALEQEAPNFPELWANSIRAAA